MSHENANPQPTWTQIVRAAGSKARDDYRTKLRPRVRFGRRKLGSLIETLGRRVKGRTQ